MNLEHHRLWPCNLTASRLGCYTEATHERAQDLPVLGMRTLPPGANVYGVWSGHAKGRR